MTMIPRNMSHAMVKEFDNGTLDFAPWSMVKMDILSSISGRPI